MNGKKYNMPLPSGGKAGQPLPDLPYLLADVLQCGNTFFKERGAHEQLHGSTGISMEFVAARIYRLASPLPTR